MACPRKRQGRVSPSVEFFARRSADLLDDEIDARGHLRDRVLDLDARVHLHEIELAVVVHQEFERSERRVARLAQRVPNRVADRRAELVRHHGTRRFLDELLVAALQRALALAERPDLPVLIGERLKLDVLRLLDETLEVELGIFEGVHRLGGRGFERAAHLSFTANDAHAAPAAAAARLDHDRVADAGGFGLGVLGVSQRFATGQERQAVFSAPSRELGSCRPRAPSRPSAAR